MARFRALCLYSGFLSICAAASTGIEQKVDELFRPVAGGKSPGAAVAVVRENKVVLMKSYGMADVEKAVPNSPSTIFRLASVTKPFTAMAVLQLVDFGKLKLDDPLTKYLPQFAHWPRVCIRHLLSHTGGVPDFVTYEELGNLPLEFEPGTRINYSNIGYLLLGRVIEKVSGQTWEEYLREHVFHPLGMEHSGYDNTDVLPGRATGYLATKEGAYNPVSAQDARGAHSAGGLYSTVEDLVKWTQGIAEGRLLRRETLETAFTPNLLRDGRRTQYGYGWVTRTYRGLREIGHGGDITGFNTYIAIYPDQQTTVMVLSNVGMRPPGPLPGAIELTHHIADAVLADRMAQPEAPAQVRVDPKILDRYAGRYKLQAPQAVVAHMGSHIVIERCGDGLIVESNGIRLPLEARSETVFQAIGSPAELTFACGARDKCGQLALVLMGLREFHAVRVSE
jgi:CubicO group peptidase (beta-lactamase class C family)